MKLKEMPKTVVYCKNKEEHQRVLKIYQDNGWEWCHQPATNLHYSSHSECIEVKNHCISWACDSATNLGFRIMSVDEFLSEQGIEPTLTRNDFKESVWVECIEDFQWYNEGWFRKGIKYQVKYDGSVYAPGIWNGYTDLSLDSRHYSKFRKCSPPEPFRIWDTVVFISDLSSRPDGPAIPKGTTGRIVRTKVFVDPPGEEYEIDLDRYVNGANRVCVRFPEDPHCLVLIERKMAIEGSDRCPKGPAETPSDDKAWTKYIYSHTIRELGNSPKWNFEITPTGCVWVKEYFDTSYPTSPAKADVKPSFPKSIMSNFVQFLKDKTRSKDERTLIRAGLIAENNDITPEGKEALLAVLFDENKDKLVKLADEKIAEEEKAKKCK